jgi:hypothetical protein
MPKSLTQFLEISGQVSIRQVREARRAQRFFGGSLLYNLVRLKILPEHKAKSLLSEWMELPYAPLPDLITIPREVLQLVDPAVAARRRVLPFQQDGDQLLIATARLGNDLFFGDLKSRNKLLVVPHTIMEEHLEPLLEKHYGIPACKRETVRLAQVDNPLEHLAHGHGGTQAWSTEPDVASTEMGLDGLPLNSDATPSQTLPTESDDPMALLDTVANIHDSAPTPTNLESTSVVRSDDETTAPMAGMASPLERLARAGNRTEIGAAAVDHALACGISRVALLGRRRESLVGWHAGGSGVTVDRFARLTIPFYTPSIFAGFKITGNPYTGVIPNQPANLEFLGALGTGATPAVVAAVPVRLGNRTVAALYADGGPGATTALAQEPLVQLAGKIAAALEILILRRKILA